MKVCSWNKVRISMTEEKRQALAVRNEKNIKRSDDFSYRNVAMAFCVSEERRMKTCRKYLQASSSIIL